MMLFYDPHKRIWFHKEEKKFTLGKDAQLLESIQPINNQFLSFKINEKACNLGPLIGIMTSRKEDHSIAGNGPLFRKLQKSLMDLGGLSIVFTSESLSNNGITGFIYLPEHEQWVKVEAPLPHLVYNRIPYRKIEKTHSFMQATQFLQEKRIPFFNPGFIDKYQLYLLLKEHSLLKQYLPYTEALQDFNQFHSFVQKYKNVYLKPTLSAKGKGIYKLSLKQNEEISLQGILVEEYYQSLSELWNKKIFSFIKESYLIQEEVVSSKIDNRRFDFRILAHFDDGEYKVTGIGIRKSELQEITTHIPNGGEIVPYEQIQTDKHDEFIHMIVKMIGNYLSEKIGFFGEFSIDAGYTKDGKYVIYEVNSKPMSFDEVDIEKKKMERLCKLFFTLAGFD